MSDPIHLEVGNVLVHEVVLGDGTLQEALVVEAAAAKKSGRIAVTMTYATWAPPARAIVDGVEKDLSMQEALAGIHLVLVSDDHVDAAKTLGLRVAIVPALQKLEADGTVSAEQVITGGAWGENVPAEMAPKLAAWAATLRASLAAAVEKPAVDAPRARPADSAAPATSAAPASGIPPWLAIVMVLVGLGGVIAGAVWKVTSDNEAKRARNEEIRQRVEKDVRDAAEKSRKKAIPPT